MKKVIIGLVLIFVCAFVFSNTIEVGRAATVDGAAVIITVNDKGILSVITPKTRFALDEYRKTSFIRLLELQLDLVEAVVRDEMDIEYNRATGRTVVTSPVHNKVFFGFYTNGSGGEESCGLSFEIFDGLGFMIDKIELDAANARLIVGFLVKSSAIMTSISDQIETLNRIVARKAGIGLF